MLLPVALVAVNDAAELRGGDVMKRAWILLVVLATWLGAGAVQAGDLGNRPEGSPTDRSEAHGTIR